MVRIGLRFLPVSLLLLLSACAVPLVKMARDGDINRVQTLLDHGADINKRDRSLSGHNMTALAVAAANGHTDIVRLLLDHGANVNQPPEILGLGASAAYPLVAAAENGHTEIVRLLIEHGADVTVISLLDILKNDHVETARLLLDHGADPNMQYGAALKWAAWNSRAEVVDLLLEKGADPNLKKGALRNFSEYLLDATADVVRHASSLPTVWKDDEMPHPLVGPAVRGDLEMTRRLLDHGANINAKHDGITPLMIAAYNGYTDLARLLLERGADPTESSTHLIRWREFNGTAAEIATRRGHASLAELLRQAEDEHRRKTQ